MRLILLLTLLSYPALAQTQLFYEDSQPATLTVPTANPTSYFAGSTRPLLLTGYTSVRVTVCPHAGESLAGTGTIRLYLWVPYIGGVAGRWTANPTIDLAVTMTTLGVCQVYDRKVGVSSGYILPATQGVSDTGGVSVLVRVDPGKN